MIAIALALLAAEPASPARVTVPGVSMPRTVAGELTVRGAAQPNFTASGGHLSRLVFAVIGDSRPGKLDDVAGYPRQVIGQIYRDLQERSPRPAFVVATGDYMNNTPGAGTAALQVAAYLDAARAFSGPVFPAMGNHECANAVSSECGPQGPNGSTENYQAFLGGLLQRGLALPTATPYYALRVEGGEGNRRWTAKFLFIAANAWDAVQADWLTRALEAPTTYTFVVRHERTLDDAACPGAAASTAILAKRPPTLLLVGHFHEFAVHKTSAVGSAELVVGNGGAPLYAQDGFFGYVVCAQGADLTLSCQAYDYQSNGPAGSALVVEPSGRIVE